MGVKRKKMIEFFSAVWKKRRRRFWRLTNRKQIRRGPAIATGIRRRLSRRRHHRHSRRRRFRSRFHRLEKLWISALNLVPDPLPVPVPVWAAVKIMIRNHFMAHRRQNWK